MAQTRLTLHGLVNVTQKIDLVFRVRSAIDQYFLCDLKIMLQPGQAPAPLIIAVALGTILSFIPAPLLDSLLVGVIFARYRQVNRAALLTARVVWNDLVVVPLYVPGFRFGMRLLEPFFVNNSALSVRFIAFSLGLVILASAATFISAVVMFSIVTVLDQWRRSSL